MTEARFKGAETASPPPSQVGLSPLCTWPAWRLQRAYACGEVTPTVVMEAVLQAAETRGRVLGAFANLFTAQARDAALRSTAMAMLGPAPGRRGRRLRGIPLSIKDDLFTAGLPTLGGSRAFADHVPTDEGAPVARARAQGALVFGKTNLSELSMLLDPGSPLHGPCRNPWNPERIAGASSGGAAAAVAAGIGPLALATDTGGSIRYPAALCGTIGFVPSSGRVPRHGNFGVNHELCAIGPVTRSTLDAGLLLSVISGADPSDPSTWPWPYAVRAPLVPTAGLPEATGMLAARLRVGWTARIDLPYDDRVLGLIEQAARTLCQALGWTLRTAPYAPDADVDGLAAFGLISDCDRLGLMQAAGNLDEARLTALSPAVQARLQAAAQHSGSDYARALEIRRRFMARLWPVFREVDVLMGCTVGHVAPTAEQAHAVGRSAVSRLWWTNFAGAPAATLPVGQVDGLPVGLHIAARPGSDALLLAACARIERELAPGANGFACAPPV